MTKPHPLIRRALTCAAVVALAVPAAASAAPDRTTTLSSGTAQYAWDGPEGTGSYDPVFGSYSVEECTKDPATYCDQTLVQVVSGGPVSITATIGDYSNPAADYDLYIYKSSSSGAAVEDDRISDSGAPSSAGLPNGFEESATVEGIEPGYYLVNVVYYETFGAGTYKGTVAIEGATPAPGGSTPPPSDPGTGGGGGGGGGTPPPSSTPPPSGGSTLTTLPFKAASSVGSAKKAKKKRSLSFKATADQDISNLVVQLLSGKGKQKVVGTFKAASFAKGTRSIKLKLSKSVAKKLKKGKYTLASRGTVNGQALQATQAVTVKK